MLKQIETILIKEKAETAIVFGDTNSTFADTLAIKRSIFHWKILHHHKGTN
jgi:UDP-N-acetylglucosamine 2-epimerase